jgi:hypothetical protein
MALPAEYAEQQPYPTIIRPVKDGSIILVPKYPPGNKSPKDQKVSLVSAFAETDSKEIALKQDEVNAYIQYQKGIPWDVPRRFHQHPDAARFRLHGDKDEPQMEMEIVGHAILDWQFNGGDKRIMRIASYARGHHPGYGVLINNGLSEKQDDRYVGKETVMERTVYFNHPDGATSQVNDFRPYNGFKIVDDRFVTKYPKEIEELMKNYSLAHFQKDKGTAEWARDEAKTQGYDFEFYYNHPRVVIPGSARYFPIYGYKPYF